MVWLCEFCLCAHSGCSYCVLILSKCVKGKMIKEGRKTDQTENENEFCKFYLWHSEGKGNGSRDDGKADAARVICSPELSVGVCLLSHGSPLQLSPTVQRPTVTRPFVRRLHCLFFFFSFFGSIKF